MQNDSAKYILVQHHDKGSNKWLIYTHEDGQKFEIKTVTSSELFNPENYFDDHLVNKVRSEHINHGTIGIGIMIAPLKKYLNDYQKNYQI